MSSIYRISSKGFQKSIRYRILTHFHAFVNPFRFPFRQMKKPRSEERGFGGLLMTAYFLIFLMCLAAFTIAFFLYQYTAKGAAGTKGAGKSKSQ